MTEELAGIKVLQGINKSTGTGIKVLQGINKSTEINRNQSSATPSLQPNGRKHYAQDDTFNPFMPTVAFNICCPRDCVSRHNGGTSGAPLKPLRDDSALRALFSLRGLRGALNPHYAERRSL